MTLDSTTVDRPGRRPTTQIGLKAVRVACLGLLIGTMLPALLAVQVFGFKVLTVQSSSMEPALVRGDLIVSRPVPIDAVLAGDIVLIDQGRDAAAVVAHRVVGFTNVQLDTTNAHTAAATRHESRWLRTQGDAEPNEDVTVVNSARLRGVVWLRLPATGRLFNQFPIQEILGAVAILALLGWLAYELRGHRPQSAPGKPAGG